MVTRPWILAMFVAVTTAASFAVTHEGSGKAIPQALSERTTSGRLGSAHAWRSCGKADSAALIPRASCGSPARIDSPEFRRIGVAIAEVRETFGSESSIPARHARALSELLLHSAAPAGIDRALAELEAARAAAPDDPELLNDLAVANIALAERDQSLVPLLRALDALEAAVALDATLPAPLFNRALVLERLYLVASAKRAWERYLALERDAGWRGEGASHLAATARLLPTKPRNAADHTREMGFALLGKWAEAVLRSDERAAISAIDLARRSLRRDTAGIDLSTGPALDDIERATQSPNIHRAQARAYAALAQGYDAWNASRWDDARAALERASVALRALGSPLAGWAALYRGSAEMNLARYADAGRTLMLVTADSGVAEPALVSRAVLLLGVCQVRQGNFERANDLYRIATPFLTGLPDRETVGYAAYLRSEGFQRAGQAPSSHAEALRALRVLAPQRRSNYLNNQLTEVAAVARDSGLHRAALTIMDEVVGIAPNVGKPEVVALALSRRARDQFGLGRTEAGFADLRSASDWGERMERGRGFARIRAALLATRGELTRPHDPRAALPFLDSALHTFRQFNTDPYLPGTLYEAARAARDAGLIDVARVRIDEAVGVAERMQAGFRSSGGRAVFADRVERISDLAVTLAVDGGRDAEAFQFLERARGAVTSTMNGERRGARNLATMHPDSIASELPAGVLVAEFALLEDRMIIWSLTRRRVRMHIVPVRRDSIAAMVDRFRHEILSSPQATTPMARRLSRLLFDPLQEELDAAERLIVIPDRELHLVPFAALADAHTSRPLVEARAVLTAPSAAFLIAAMRRHSALRPGMHALVVGDPALTAAGSTRLPQLPGAAAEAASIARLHPTSTLLIGTSARQPLVVERLARASLLHFAGHAVFNLEQPELSYLALAPDGGDDGRLSAAEIDNLRLPHVRVAVLSACSTLNQRPTRAGPSAGIAYSFLSAGVPATISTLWDVSDLATIELLVELHRALARGDDPASALRHAQRYALQSQDPALRRPSTWAAFTFTGY